MGDVASRTLDSDLASFYSGAQFSPCRRWRYSLWRRWDWQGHANVVAFVGLNPSTADASLNDPTIRRCINFAKSWGYGGIVMLNVFAYRATFPVVLGEVAQEGTDVIGPDNDEALGYYRSQAGLIVVAWGTPGSVLRRQVNWDARLKQVLSGGCLGAAPLWCLGTTQDGSPRHPLYVKSDTRLARWDP